MNTHPKLWERVKALEEELERLNKELKNLKVESEGGWIEYKVVYCKKCRPCRGHGPYAYLRWYENGRLKSKYLGKAETLSVREVRVKPLLARRRRLLLVLSKIERILSNI